MWSEQEFLAPPEPVTSEGWYVQVSAPAATMIVNKNHNVSNSATAADPLLTSGATVKLCTVGR